MSENNRIAELISAYALGILDGDDLIEAEKYIKENPQKYKDLIAEYELTISQMAHALKAEEPNPELKDKLLAEIRSGSKPLTHDVKVPFWQRFQPIITGFAAASVVIIIALLAYIYSIDSKLGGQQAIISELQSQIQEKDSEIAVLKKDIEGRSYMLAFLENPEVVIINLVKTEPDLKAVGRVLWNPDDDEAMFYALELPEVPQGKTYQLWAIADGEPKSAGVFSVDEKGNYVHVIKSLKDIGNVSAFAVSVEPAGGVTLPTGKIVLMGESRL